MNFDQITTVLSLIVAVIVALSTFYRNNKRDTERNQIIRDKLDNISNIAQETKDSVKALDAKLDDQAVQISKLETRLDEHERRLDRIEKRCEKHSI